MLKKIRIIAGTLSALTILQAAAMAAPYDRFSTQDQAAINWAEYYNGKSIKAGLEYGSYICKDSKGYYYNEANVGTAHQVYLPTSGAPRSQRVAYVHTHGAATFAYSETSFSQADLKIIYNNGNLKTGYLVETTGRVQRADNAKKSRGINWENFTWGDKYSATTKYVQATIAPSNIAVDKKDTYVVVTKVVRSIVSFFKSWF